MGDHDVEPQPSLMATRMEEPVRPEPPNRADYHVNFRQVSNGFIIEVGCQSIVFEDLDKAFKYTKMYFEDPSGTTQKYLSGELFK